MVQHFNTRLRSARKIAGLTLQELAEQINVSKQTLSYYEQGKVSPTSATLIALARALNVKPDYFFRPQTVSLQDMKFRKEEGLSQKEIKQIQEQTRGFLERYHELEALMGIEANTHGGTLVLTSPHIANNDDIERAAEDFREQLSLGDHPIRSVVELLEEQSFYVYDYTTVKEFVGMSGRSEPGGQPVIVLNTNADIVRKRLTALHEAAHLLLTFPETMSERDEERACHDFAAAVLLPKRVLTRELGEKRSRITLGELVHLKKYYGISVQAIEMRLFKLGIIGAGSHRAFWDFVNAQVGGKRIDPGGDVYQGMETPTRFKQLLFRAAAEGIISESKAASLANQPVAEFTDEMRWK